MYFHHVRDITVSGFSADTAPNSAEPAANKVFVSGKIDRPQGHALYLRFVDVGGADVAAATASFTPWFKDANAGTWVSSAPVAAAPSGRLQLIAMTGDTFVQVTALASVGASVTLQVWSAEVAGDAAIDGEVAAASAQIAGEVEAGSLDVEDDAAVGGDLDVAGAVTSHGGQITLSFLTPVASLAALTSGTVIAIPAIPGFYPLTTSATLYATSGAGVCTTGPSLQLGNNAGEDNVAASTAITAASVNAAIAAGFPSRLGALGIPTGTTTKQLKDLSTAVTLKITVPGSGTGGFALSGYINTVVTLAPI